MSLVFLVSQIDFIHATASIHTSYIVNAQDLHTHIFCYNGFKNELKVQRNEVD